VSVAPVRLADEQLVELADLIADRLRSPAGTQPLVSAAELAERLGVDLKSVYRHSEQLGAIRVGRRLRFDPARAISAWGSREGSGRSQPPETPIATGRKATRRRASSAADCPLLPVGRRSPSNGSA
jgi:hypothetical protein